ncbi:uncharacterized protein LOC123697598 [Colias croceus]|uniref:uncharacterized protein LOC123697598 n=1 Tax=Colias crocea TaxID=72248 RepID=UPI001E27BB93|nr:uncharacterized protein LOC123697598 [Colias croceus]
MAGTLIGDRRPTNGKLQTAEATSAVATRVDVTRRIMCLNIEVILPTVRKFLLLYPLRNGCLLIFVWTLFQLRTSFDVILFSTALLESLIGKPFPLGTLFIQGKSPGDNTYSVYYSYIVLIINESLLLVYTIHLGIGVCQEIPYLLKQYLICRSITWFTEMLFLSILCSVHKSLIGWYLGILIFVVLEFYAFVVVYSFYSTLVDDCNMDK